MEEEILLVREESGKRAAGYELVLSPQGTGWLQAGKENLSCGPLGAVLLAPGTARRYPPEGPDNPLRVLLLPGEWDPSGPAGELLRAVRDAGWLQLRLRGTEEQSLLGTLGALQALGAGEYAAQAGEHLTLAALLLLERCRRRALPGTPGRRRTGEALAALAMRVIRERYAEELTLAELSKRLYVSPAHLSRVLRRETGKTFGEALNATRLEQARALLRDTGDLAIDIAVACGFSSAQHFCAAFKRESGMTPLQYRRACREKKGGPG